MAIGVGTGFDLSGLEKAIKKAEENLKKLGTTNKNVVESIGNFWKNIGEQGLDSYLLSLEKQKKVLKDIASIRFDDKAPEALKKYGENASKSIDQLNTLIEALNQLQKQRTMTQSSSQLQVGNTDYWNWEKQQMEDNLVAYRKNKEEKAKADKEEYEARKKQLQETFDAEKRYYESKVANATALAKSYEKELAERKRAQEEILRNERSIREFTEQSVKSRTDEANRKAQGEHDANQKAFQQALAIQQQALERFARNEHEKREEIKRTRDAGLEAAQTLDKAQAKTESLNRAKNYQRTQKYGDTSSQALAAYDRLVSGKGQLSVNNMQDVLSKLEQAQNKINLKTSEGRERYNELEAAIKKVKATIDSVVNAEENAAKKRAKNADEAKKHAEEERKSLEKRLKLLKDIADEQSKSRSSLYRLTQSSGDTTKQAEAAYNRIYGDKGIQSIKNFNDVLSKLESAQVKINQRTEDGRKKYEEFEKMIQRVKSSIQDLTTPNKANSDYYAYLSEKLIEYAQQSRKVGAQILADEKNYHSQRQAMYEKLFSLQAKYLNDVEKMSARVYNRTDGKAWNVSAEDVIKRHQDELRQRKKYIDEMTNMYARMFDEIARRESQNRASKYSRIQSTGDTTSQALAAYNRLYSDKGIKNINNMNNALQRLRDAQSKLNLNTEEGRKKYSQLGDAIKRVEKDMAKLSQQSENVNKKHSQLLNISEQLQRRLALVFSVSQITGYINKIVQVRGEFELQQKALQAIVQNTDKANKLWDKTVALAVKSPFRVKELVTYTKQLAAYRIETSQLYDTTKRLADVSAGLGVDMQRLILAYGQVRAANFLRGTELRQFTEAGIPMLEELAKHFTELEGRAISVGDVFERISNRMVTFEDVSAVFQRMTNNGGIFYDMQAKQSETLKGQISNLHDAIDLMMNDIGKANDGVLKNSVSFARSFVENWREIAFHIEKVVVALASWKIANAAYILGTKKSATATLWGNNALKAKIGTTLLDIKSLTWQETKILGVTKAQFAMGKATLWLQGALRGVGLAMKTILPIAVIAGFFELYRIMTKASREAERLKKELEGIITEDVSNLEKNSDAYQDLYTRLGLLNKGTKARNDIISRLNSEYGEYLNFVVDEETSVEQLAEAYDDVVKKMKEKQSLATFEKGLTAITESYKSSLNDAKEEFYDLFKGARIKSNKNKFSFIVPTKKEVDDIYSIIQQRSREMKAEQLDGLSEQAELIQSIVKEYYGEEFSLSRDFNSSIDILDILVDKKEKEKELQDEINSQYKTALKSREANLALEKLQTEYAEKRRDIENNGKSQFEIQKGLSELATQEKLDVIDIKVRFGEMDEDSGNRAKEKIINWATELNRSINDTIKINLGESFSEEDLSKVLITESIQKSKSSSDYVKQIQSSWETQNQIIKEQISLKSAGLDTDEYILKNAEKLERLYRGVADILGIELKYTERLSEESRNAINAMLPEEYQITLEQSYNGIDSILSNLKTKEKEHLNVIEQLNEQKRNGLPIDEEKLRIAEENYWWVKKTQDLIDPSVNTPISESKVSEINAKLEDKYKIDSIDRTKDEVTLLSNANTEKEKAIAYEKQLLAMQTQGLSITQDELDLAKKDIEQWTLRWKLLGGTEEEKERTSRSNSLYDERIKVIDDMNKKYKELNQTLDESEALQGAFNAYIDAFATAYDGISWIPSNVRKMTPQEFTYKVLNFPNENDLVSFLDKLSKEPMKTFEKIKVELAKGEYVYDMKVRVKTEEDKELIDRIEDMFGNYEVSLELEKLNIPQDLAKRLFGLDAIDLSSIRNEIENKLSSARASGGQEELVKNLEEQLKKVEDLEDKALKERLKRYSQFLVKGQSERVRIKIEELRELAKLEEDYQSKRIEKTDYELAKKGIQDEYKRKQQDLVWDEFTESDTYIKMFEDLDKASTSSIRKMINRIEDLKGSISDLDPKNVKELIDALEKLKDEDLERNPFRAMSENAKEWVQWLTQAIRLNKELKNAEKKEKESQRVLSDNEDKYSKAQADYERISKDKNATDNQKKAAKDALDMYKTAYQSAKAGAESAEETAKKARITKEELRDAALLFASGLSGASSKVKEYTDALSNLASHFSKDAGEFISGVGGGISSILGGAGSLASGNPLLMIQGASDIIGGIKNIKGTFDALHDKKNEREIQSQIELVDKLGKQYEKLEKQIDKAYSLDTLQESYQAGEENLKQQIAAYDSMIAAEEGKKNTDDNRIKEWKEAQEKLQEQIEELRAQAFNEATGGILDDVKSAAREWTDAWFEAFAETGNGLDGLKDHFKENMLEMVKQQASMLITGTYLDDWKKKLEDYVNADDMRLETDEAKEWADYVTKSFPELNAALEAFATSMEQAGVSIKGAGELSGLQRGIQGITEEQSDILASYLNSIRLYVSQNTEHLSKIAASFDTSIENPMLPQLRIIATQTTAIRELLDNVTINGGAAAFNVRLLDE